MFASRSDFLARSNAERIAQLAVPADKEMPAITLRAAINGEDLSAYPEVDQETITLALDTIDKCLADADALLISYGIPKDVQSACLLVCHLLWRFITCTRANAYQSPCNKLMTT